MAAEGIAASIYGVAALLLIGSGQSKVRRPLSTARAMYAMGLPAHFLTVQLLGAVELLIGVAALSTPHGLPARLGASAAAVLYLAFAGFLALALLRGKHLGSCGCAGNVDLPPSWLHAGADLVAVGAASASVFGATITPYQLLERSAFAGALWVLIELVAALAVYHLILRLAGSTTPARSPV